MKKIIPILLTGAVLSGIMQSCNIGHPSWDVDLLAPAAHTKITAENLFGSEYISADANGKVFIDFNESVYNFNVDTLTTLDNIGDTTTFLWPLGNINFPPGLPFPTQEIDINLDAEPIQLTRMQLKEGVLRIEIKSLVKEPLNINYYSNAIVKNGNPLSLSETIAASTNNDTVTLIKNIPLDGYAIDLRGKDGTQFNKFQIYVDAKVSPSADSVPLVNGELLFNATTTILTTKPYSVQGDFGQINIGEQSDTLSVDILKKLSKDLIDIESIQMDLTLINTLGCILWLKPKNFSGINTKNGQMLTLTHPIFGSFIKMAPAAKTYNIPPLAPNTKTYNFNAGNSNLEAFIENLPDKFVFELVGGINLFGNIYGNQNFAFAEYPPEIVIDIYAPLKFEANNLAFKDTVTFSFEDSTVLDPVNGGLITIYAENTFPFNLGLDLVLVDNGMITDSILISKTGSQANGDYILSGEFIPITQSVTPVKSVLKIPINAERKQKLIEADQVIINAYINTQPEGQNLQIFTSSYLDLKFILNLNYKINL